MPGRLLVRLTQAVLLGAIASCASAPPAITGVTIFPAEAGGEPRGASMCRTLVQPPIPVIGLRPGSDPRQGSLWLNDPASGRVTITLARGMQNFVLYCARLDASERYVIAVFLDDESTPSLSAVVDRGPIPSIRTAAAPMLEGLDGTLVANHSGQSAVRHGYRVTLRGAVFPLEGISVDTLGPWTLNPDGAADLAGVLTIDVQPAAASPGG